MKEAFSAPLSRRHWLLTASGLIAGLHTARAETNAKIELPLRLSINENPFGPSPRAVVAMERALRSSFRYPHDHAQQLVDFLAKKENVPAEQILLGVGSGEILTACGRFFGAAKGEVVCAVPGYTQLTEAMRQAGSTVVGVPLNERWEHDLPAMAAKVSDRTTCVYLCNPNNPTGTVCEPQAMRDFVRVAAKRAPVFVDEAYLECADDFESRTLVDMVREGHDVIVSRTFSKLHGLAGQRIGYAVMSAKRVAEIKALMTGNPNLLGMIAARASAEDLDYQRSTRKALQQGREAITAVLQGLGRKSTQSQANFVFFHTGMPIETFQQAMAAEKIIVARPFPPMLDWCRLTIGLPQEMEHVHRALKKILG